nr:MAG TPA: hypothetical protein [Caudoviricetes sp.]
MVKKIRVEPRKVLNQPIFYWINPTIKPFFWSLFFGMVKSMF